MKTQNNYLELHLNFSTEEKRIIAQIETLHKHKSQMNDYLRLKVEQEDWHGVADAAMDIREIVAKLTTFQSILDDLTVHSMPSDPK